ncbi:helix-turn-helix domain-containing protein [Streptomyces sp. NPDC014006]|uniref:helix-turn-helix domain-containing protein n=1 Tax=Streptomyces sp. NPDC014006 TaxID=3364870 RepID=UPI0036FBC6E1
MGRPEKPVDQPVYALKVLAEILRSMRREANLTFADLAARTHYSASQLQRASGGMDLPTWHVVRAYTEACSALCDEATKAKNMNFARVAHDAASDAMRSVRRDARRSTVLPKPQYVRDQADLSGALRDAWARAGRPSMRDMEADSLGLLPRSTAHAICKGRTVPRNFRQFVAFLDACNVTGAALKPWYGAFLKVFGMPYDGDVAAVLGFFTGSSARESLLDFYLENCTTKEEETQRLMAIARLYPRDAMPFWVVVGGDQAVPFNTPIIGDLLEVMTVEIPRNAEGGQRQTLAA